MTTANDNDNVIHFSAMAPAKAVSAPALPQGGDPHMVSAAIQGMAATIHGDIANRLGHEDFTFVVAIWSGTGEYCREYVFGKPAYTTGYRGWLATMLAKAARMARREERP